MATWDDHWFADEWFANQWYNGTKPPETHEHLGGPGWWNHLAWNNEWFINQWWCDTLNGNADAGIRDEDIPHGVPEKKKKTRRGRKAKQQPAHREQVVLEEVATPRVFGPWIDLDKRDRERLAQAQQLTQEAIARVQQRSEEELMIVMMMVALADEEPEEDEEQIAIDFMLALAQLT